MWVKLAQPGDGENSLLLLTSARRDWGQGTMCCPEAPYPTPSLTGVCQTIARALQEAVAFAALGASSVLPHQTVLMGPLTPLGKNPPLDVPAPPAYAKARILVGVRILASPILLVLKYFSPEGGGG